MQPTLLILAAGMGSRYGGLKQLDPLGPHGETIMDYSVHDAVAAGYGKVVFVIRKSMEEDFKTSILEKYRKIIPVEYVFQELDNLPAGFTVNPDRVKPYGTAHAILVAKDAIHEPFTVINADDYYGADAYRSMSAFLQQKQGGELPVFAMVGYQLNKTLSEHGSVSRGICKTNEQDELISITEMTKIQRQPSGIFNLNEDGTTTFLPETCPVSMNFWGFTPLFLECLNELFIDFLKNENHNPKAEFVLPKAVNHFLVNKTAVVKVLKTNAEWFGVTFQEDKPLVMAKLKDVHIN